MKKKQVTFIPTNATEEELNQGGVYLITNKLTNKKYIGSTHLFRERKYVHEKRINQLYLNEKLYLDLANYGAENFDFQIIAIENNLTKRLEIEETEIKKYFKQGEIYNTHLKPLKPNYKGGSNNA